MFERLNIKDDEEQNGYGEWFTSNSDVNETTISNASEMNDAFNAKKQTMRALIVHKGIQDTSNES